jgi:hypothetical protein
MALYSVSVSSGAANRAEMRNSAGGGGDSATAPAVGRFYSGMLLERGQNGADTEFEAAGFWVMKTKER